MIVRWCAWKNPRPGVIRGLRGDVSFDVGIYTLGRLHLSSSQLRVLQGSNQVWLFHGLNSDPNRMTQRVKSWVAAQGVTIEAGDQVTNVLRKIRNAVGLSEADFDISPPF